MVENETAPPGTAKQPDNEQVSPRGSRHREPPEHQNARPQDHGGQAGQNAERQAGHQTPIRYARIGRGSVECANGVKVATWKP